MLHTPGPLALATTMVLLKLVGSVGTILGIALGGRLVLSEVCCPPLVGSMLAPLAGAHARGREAAVSVGASEAVGEAAFAHDRQLAAAHGEEASHKADASRGEEAHDSESTPLAGEESGFRHDDGRGHELRDPFFFDKMPHKYDPTEAGVETLLA